MEDENAAGGELQVASAENTENLQEIDTGGGSVEGVAGGEGNEGAEEDAGGEGNEGAEEDAGGGNSEEAEEGAGGESNEGAGGVAGGEGNEGAEEGAGDEGIEGAEEDTGGGNSEEAEEDAGGGSNEGVEEDAGGEGIEGAEGDAGDGNSEEAEEGAGGEGIEGAEEDAGGEKGEEVESFFASTPSGIQVWAQAPKGAFGCQVKMSAEDVSQATALQAAKQVSGHGEIVLDAVAVNIYFRNEQGEELDPYENKVEVKITLPQEKVLAEGDVCLIHQHDDGSVELVNADAKSTEGATFETESFSIFVITSLGAADKDKIHEYLVGWNFYEAPVVGGYYVNNANAPYVLYVGEVFELYATEGMAPDYGFWVEQTENPKIIDRTAEHPYNYNEEHRVGDTYVNYVHAQYVAKTAGKAVVHLSGSGANAAFYVEVLDDNEICDHADIEIADGGWYKDVRSIYDEYGNLVRTSYVYDAVVSKVNNAYVYDSNDNLLQHYVTNDYSQIGEPGTTQYELTSKWDVNGNGSTKSFSRKNAHHALFDVNVTYILKEKIVETIASGQEFGTSQSWPASAISDSEISKSIEKTNLMIQMNQQDVIDARNKCPNHSGLDFTTRSRTQKNYVSVSLVGDKNLAGGTMEADQFQFELLNADNQVIGVAYNDEYGKIVFPDIIYEFEEDKIMAPLSSTSYNYKLREVTPAVPGPYQYDAKVIDVTVKITSDKDGKLTAELLNPELFGRFEFTNVALYLLPETGGGGILLYLTGGVMLMILSILFLYRRKMRPGS